MPGIHRALQTALTRREIQLYRYGRVGGLYRTIGPAAHNILHIQNGQILAGYGEFSLTDMTSHMV
jgi:hypothetical protein